MMHAESIKQEFASLLHAPIAIVCATFEAQLIGMESDDRELFVEELKQ
jgi:hypothetical protein